MVKYDPLAQRLEGVPQDVQVVTLTFEEIDTLVGGLPASARTLQEWWANNSHGQALAWRAAGFHVEGPVDLRNGRVRLVRGRVGGSHRDRLRGRG